MWIKKNINLLMFRKLFIALICIGTICFSFTMVTTGDEKTGEETIQLPVPSAAKKEKIKLSEDRARRIDEEIAVGIVSKTSGEIGHGSPSSSFGSR